MSRLAEGIDERDGYFLLEDIAPDDIHVELSLAYRDNGEVVQAMVMYKAAIATPGEYGAYKRNKCLYEAMCRYLNTAPERYKMEAAIDQFVKTFNVMGGLIRTISPPWVLWDTQQEVETMQAVYCNEETNEVMVWNQDEYVELMDLQEFEDGLNEADDDDEEAGGFVQSVSNQEAQAQIGVSSELNPLPGGAAH